MCSPWMTFFCWCEVYLFGLPPPRLQADYFRAFGQNICKFPLLCVALVQVFTSIILALGPTRLLNVRSFLVYDWLVALWFPIANKLLLSHLLKAHCQPEQLFKLRWEANNTRDDWKNTHWSPPTIIHCHWPEQCLIRLVCIYTEGNVWRVYMAALALNEFELSRCVISFSDTKGSMCCMSY